MTVEARNGNSSIAPQVQQEPGGDNHLLSEEDFLQSFLETWRANRRGEIGDKERIKKLDGLWGRVSEETREKLTTKDAEGQTPIRRVVVEFQREQKIEDLKLKQRGRSKMGQGRKPPRGQRKHVRREKAKERGMFKP